MYKYKLVKILQMEVQILVVEFFKFSFYSILIVVISKYFLVEIIRKLANTLNIKPKIVGYIAGFATSIPELLTVATSSITGLFRR